MDHDKGHRSKRPRSGDDHKQHREHRHKQALSRHRYSHDHDRQGPRERSGEHNRKDYKETRNRDHGRDPKTNQKHDHRKHEYNRPIKQERQVTSEQDQPSEKKKEHEEPEKPNYSLSGKLAEDTNKFNGVVIKYSEPPEAKIPKRRWRLYPFKGEEGLPVIYLEKQSAFLLGRDRRVADIPIDHPSCSKQHAVIQFRCVSFEREDGTTGRRVRPYLIDLGSANGTFLNNKQIEAERYYELFEKDVIKYGYSSREYVILHDECVDYEEGIDEEGVEIIEKED